MYLCGVVNVSAEAHSRWWWRVQAQELKILIVCVSSV